jgi:secreted trypsin-like serine protease
MQTDVELCYIILQGDSGGPLMFLDTDGKYIQVGIMSFRAAASCTNNPAGYTRVTSYLGWISTATGIAISRSAFQETTY